MSGTTLILSTASKVSNQNIGGTEYEHVGFTLTHTQTSVMTVKNENGTTTTQTATTKQVTHYTVYRQKPKAATREKKALLKLQNITQTQLDSIQTQLTRLARNPADITDDNIYTLLHSHLSHVGTIQFTAAIPGREGTFPESAIYYTLKQKTSCCSCLFGGKTKVKAVSSDLYYKKAKRCCFPCF